MCIMQMASSQSETGEEDVRNLHEQIKVRTESIPLPLKDDCFPSLNYN